MRTVPFGSTTRVLLVDDHTLMRDGLRRILKAEHSDWFIAEANSGFEAIDMMRRDSFDMAIVDLSMPGMSGIDLIRRLKAERPGLRVLVLSMHAEEQYAMRAFNAGASGYVTKDSAPTELVTAVNKIVAGGVHVTSSLAERVVQQLNGHVAVPRHAHLSDRELEVLRRLVAGRRLVEIATELHLSVKTISTHKTRIQEKLGLDSLAALVRYGLENHLDRDQGDSAAGMA
ncbi:MAG: response regulator transcription factor [Burkholderiales bacterium]|nr:response regulator transcription factor [Burkholderiales bacterium]